MLFKVIPFSTRSFRESLYLSDYIFKMLKDLKSCEFNEKLFFKPEDSFQAKIDLYLANIDSKTEKLNILVGKLLLKSSMFSNEINSKNYFMLLKSFLNVSFSVMTAFNKVDNLCKKHVLFKNYPLLTQKILDNPNLLSLKFNIFKSFSLLAQNPENMEWIKESLLFKRIYDNGKLKTFSKPNMKLLAEELVKNIT